VSAPLICSATESWIELLDGDLSPDQWARYERHLETCTACQQRLDRVEALTAPLKRLGREVGDPTVAPRDHTLSHFLDRMREVKSPLGIPPVEPTDLYFLQPADRPDLLGTLGQYEVQEVIGQGGMGLVLKAIDPPLHRAVAIKVLAPALAGSAMARQRFRREAQAAAAVCHEHVVTLHGVHETDGLPYLVMQYIAGESLQARLDRTGPLELLEIVRIGHQTASGLAAAHAQGLIHRDIKPANLLLENGLARVKITDFGLARMVDDVALTQNGVVAGTPEYMAPEQARGEAVDHRSDLFSLGGVLYAMCTGMPPFRASSAVAVLRRVSDEAPTPIRSLDPGVPPWLEAFIMRLLAKDPAERFQSAAEVAALLEGYLAHLRQPAVVPAPEQPPAPADIRLALSQPECPSWRARWRRGLLAALVLLTALGPGIAYWLGGAGNPAAQSDKEQKVFRQDFHGRKVDDRFWSYEPPGAEEHMKEEREGLRITVPRGDSTDNWRTVGLSTKFPVHGDCEITVSYELLRADSPPEGSGYLAAGVSLLAMADTPGRDAALLGRFNRADGQLYLCQKIFTDTAGKRQYPTRTSPTAARSGKLRLVRRGDIVTYLAADGEAGVFREISQFKLVASDLANVRVAAEFHDSVDVRIHDFEIRAFDLPTDGPGLPNSDAPQEPARKGWLATGAILGMIVLGSIALGLWLYLRQRRDTETMPVAPRLPASPRAIRPDRPTPPRGPITRNRLLAATALIAVVGLLIAIWASGDRSKDAREVNQGDGGAGAVSAGPTKSIEPVNGLVCLLVNKKSGRCLSIADGSTQPGAKIVQGPTLAQAGATERWRLLGSGKTFRLRNEASRLVVEIGSANREPGVQAIQSHDQATATHQHWTFEPVEDAYILRAGHSNLVLSIGEGSEQSGARAVQRDCVPGVLEEVWELRPTGTPRQHLAFDFRAGIQNFPSLVLAGPNVDEVAKTDAQGLRVTIPAGMADTRPVVVELEKRMRGDFEIALSYELIAVGKPVPRYGAGVMMLVGFHSPSPLNARLGRSRQLTGEQFGAHKLVTGPDGKEKYVNNAHRSATRSRGKLRLVRNGSTLHYQVAEDGDNWMRIQSVEIGTDDVKTVQLHCFTMYTPIALDVRLIELTIDADEFPNGMGSERVATGATIPEVPPETEKKGWLAGTVILGLLMALSLGGWLFLRPRRRAGQEPPDAVEMKQPSKPVEAARPIFAQCSECETKLKARADWAGKKVKCPKCGKAVVVPAIKTSDAGGAT
jgi:serine/threonine protein kinase